MKQFDTDVLISILGSILTTSTAKTWLDQVSRKKPSIEFLLQHCLDLPPEFAERPVRDLVVEFDRLARTHAEKRQREPNPNANREMFERYWVTARLLEWFGQEGHPPLCKFCYRTVELRSNGRPMDYCAHHAQSGKAKNPAGYVRGRKAFPDFERRLNELSKSDDEGVPVDHIWDLTRALLRRQYKFANAGGGDAAYLLESFLDQKWLNSSAGLEEENQADSPKRLFDEAAVRLIRIDRISDGYPSVSELAQRWRGQEGDVAGCNLLRGNQHLCVSFYMFLQQLFRYVAWYEVGDRTARVGSGRPSRIDSDQIQKMLHENMSKAEIARRFGVKPGSVYAHVTRKVGKVTAPKADVASGNANND